MKLTVFFVCFQNTRELYGKEPDECEEDELEKILVKHKKIILGLKSRCFIAVCLHAVVLYRSAHCQTQRCQRYLSFTSVTLSSLSWT